MPNVYLIMILITTVLILSTTQLAFCDKFISRKLDKDEIQDALDLAESVRSKFAKLTLDPALAPPTTLTAEEKWYSPVDVTKTRFNAIAQLIIIPFKDKKVETKTVKVAGGNLEEHATTTFTYATSTVKGSTCTAFYVAPAIIASAAHCFKDAKITPESNHVIIVRQQSDGSKEFTNALAVKYERVVVEWIYPGAYDQIPADVIWHRLSGYDYVFARVNSENEGKAFYTLASPDDLSGPPNHALLMIGYPGDAGDAKAVSVSCQLTKLRDKKAKEDAGVQRALRGRDAGDIEFNQLLCLGQKGNMQEGGSGGPWLLEETGKERVVVGISAWTFERNEIKVNRDSPAFKAAFMKEQAFCTATASPWIKTLQQLKQLEALKKAATTKTWKEVLDAL